MKRVGDAGKKNQAALEMCYLLLHVPLQVLCEPRHALLVPPFKRGLSAAVGLHLCIRPLQKPAERLANAK